jgi:hypothetical protein
MMVVEESSEGALLVWVPYTLCAPGIEHIGKHMVVLGKKDGTLNQNAHNALRKVFPSWDGQDPFALEELSLQEQVEGQELQPEFELADCYHDDSYIPTGSDQPIIQFKATWFNPIGGTQNMPAALDDTGKKKVRSKWLGKFKATAGSTTAQPAKPAAAAQPAKPAATKPAAAKPAAKAGGPPSRGAGSPGVGGTVRTSTAEEVWNALTAANQGADENDLGTRYYGAQDELFPGRNGDLNPAEWGQVADKLGV